MTSHAIALRTADQPWMGLPTVKNDGTRTNAQMIAAANLLGWNVHKREFVTNAPPVEGTDFEIVGNVGGPDSPLVRLGTGRDKYTTVQAEDLLSMADAITDGDAELDVAGYYRKGRSLFLSFRLGENIVLDPNGQADEIGRFLNLVSSHDGTSGVCAYTGNMRLACQNMLTAARAAALSTFKMRHTQNVQGRILDARKALSISFKASEVFEEEMKELIKVSVSDQQFWDLVTSIYPEPEKDVKGSRTKWERKTEDLVGFWNGETNANLDKTAYRAYNALNEHLMWGGGVRDGNTESVLVRASGLDDLTNRKNVDLYKSVLTLTA